tara:strand:- start:446 stop:1918 length:1473 start_codon:yes stop_codon:yes gene_type:complete
MKIKYLLLSVFMLALWSCETDVVNPDEVYPDPYLDIDSGDADFSTYVAMGEGITAGMTDNSLFMAGQMNSYPNIMAGVMSMAGGGEFTQPYTNDNVGGMLVGGNQVWGPRLFFNGAGPATVSGNISNEATSTMPGPYNNMAFPFVNGIHMVAPGYGSLAGLAAGAANPWFVRSASSDGATVLGDAAGQMPSFVTVMPGNDFYAYAAFGASGGGGTMLDLTSPQGMLVGVGATLQTLGAMVPSGVVTTLPDPTNTPQWNTVPWNSIPLDQATADQLNAQLAAPYNGAVAAAALFGIISPEEAALRFVNPVAGQNGVLIEDESLTLIDLSALGGPVLPNIRQANANDKIGLFALPVLGTPVDPTNPALIMGVSVPLPDAMTLMGSEISDIQSQLATANAAISASVPNGWALFDLGGLYNEVVTTGVFEDDFNMTGDLVFGGFFSLDGYNPTSRGSALIAKKMMEAIDATWGSNLSDAGLDIGDYPTNYPDGI